MKHPNPALDALIDKQFDVLDHGHVILLDYMGSDSAVVDGARRSLNTSSRKVSDDKALIRHLLRNRHTSPFELAELKFAFKMPIFVARQWDRHRTANQNQLSGRYSALAVEHYFPSQDRLSYQGINKQGSGEKVSSAIAAATLGGMLDICGDSTFAYYEMLGNKLDGEELPQHYIYSDDEIKEVSEKGGISRELARIVLTLNTYTEIVWKCDLHNILHLLSLRLPEEAQWETRQFANVMADIVKAGFPLVYEAFEDFRLNSMSLSALDIKALSLKLSGGSDDDIQNIFKDVSKSEYHDFLKKLKNVTGEK